jgi:hypothetical protein
MYGNLRERLFVPSEATLDLGWAGTFASIGSYPTWPISILQGTTVQYYPFVLGHLKMYKRPRNVINAIPFIIYNRINLDHLIFERRTYVIVAIATNV